MLGTPSGILTVISFEQEAKAKDPIALTLCGMEMVSNPVIEKIGLLQWFQGSLWPF